MEFPTANAGSGKSHTQNKLRGTVPMRAHASHETTSGCAGDGIHNSKAIPVAMRMEEKYNVVELYAGVARTWDAFRSWRKAKLGLLVDNDEFAVETYKHNFPKAKYIRRNLSWMSAR